MNLDHESMKRILIRVTQFDKAQCNKKQHMIKRFAIKTSYGFGRTVTYQRGALQEILLLLSPFYIGKPKILRTSEQDRIIKPYLTRQPLR
jgi:hypothetical protein